MARPLGRNTLVSAIGFQSRPDHVGLCGSLARCLIRNSMSQIFNNYVAGQWVESQTKKTFPNINPANTEETVGLFQAGNESDAAAACDAAALAQPAWRAVPTPRRGEDLLKAAEIVWSRLAQVH